MGQDSRKVRFGLWYDFRNPPQWRQPSDREAHRVMEANEANGKLSYVSEENAQGIEALAQAEVEEISARIRRVTLTRSFLTLGMFVIAMLLSLKFPWWGFELVCCVLLVYPRPEVLGFTQ